MCLKVSNLTKLYRGKSSEETIIVFDNLSLSIETGKFVAIIGPSGCGKTTLLKMIAGLAKPSSGEISLDGKKVEKPSSKIGLVFQEYALMPWRNTLKNIEIGLEIKGINKHERQKISKNYIDVFGLAGFEKKYPSQLSGGMQQRAAIARTLIMQPEIVLMDEPFGSLDSQTRNLMQKFLLKVWCDRKDTVVFVTHNVDEAVYLADEIIVLSSRPTQIRKRFENNLERPRDRTSPECNNIRKEVLTYLYG